MYTVHLGVLMKNILSIDLSFVMALSVGSYEEWVHSRWKSSSVQWEMISRKMGDLPKSCPRREKYLLKIFEKALENLVDPKQIVFASHHDDIINHVKDFHELIIDNIDHSHDIYYNQWNSPVELNEYNWVWWLDKNHQIDEYNWFGNKNSQDYCDYMPLYCEYNKINDRRRHKPTTKPDFIFVCESPSWVPSECRRLYSTMRALADNYFKNKE